MKNKTTLTTVIIAIFLSSCSSFTGKKTINWDTGNIAIEGEYKDDLKNGIWTFYCPNGELYNKSEFKDGFKISDCVYSFSRPGTWIKDNYIQKSYVKSTYSNDFLTNRITSSQLFIDDKLKIKITYAAKGINDGGDWSSNDLDSIIIYDRNLLKTENYSLKTRLYNNKLNNSNSLNIGKPFLTSNTIMDEFIDYITNTSSIIDFNNIKNRNEEFQKFCGLQIDNDNLSFKSKFKNGYEDDGFCHYYPDSPLDSIIDFYDLFDDETFIDDTKMGSNEAINNVSVVDLMSNIDYGLHQVYNTLILAAELKE